MTDIKTTTSGDWLDHNGGPCPVADTELVHVKMKNGRLFDLTAYSAWLYRWDNVTHYRVVTP